MVKKKIHLIQVDLLVNIMKKNLYLCSLTLFKQFITELHSLRLVGEVLIVLGTLNRYSYSVTITVTVGHLVNVVTKVRVAVATVG